MKHPYLRFSECISSVTLFSSFKNIPVFEKIVWTLMEIEIQDGHNKCISGTAAAIGIDLLTRSDLSD
jgi:hypothetical protein